RSLTVRDVGGHGVDTRDLRRGRAFPQPPDELFHDGRFAAGEHLDPAVGEIARVTAQPQRLRLADAGGAIETALDPTGHEGAAADHFARIRLRIFNNAPMARAYPSARFCHWRSGITYAASATGR